MKNITCLIITSLFIFACQDSSTSDGSAGSPPEERAVLEIQDQEVATDIPLIEVVQPDAYVDPCLDSNSSSENFCECNPECCQVQMWYCPPSGLGVTAAEVVMNLCDDDLNICDRSQDFSCPPNEILSRGSCNTILECPPGIDNRITITVACEIEGVQGEQEILCTKGDIIYGECIVCEPGEERCNYQDDDCDGIADENQQNDCGMCGPVPGEVCNSLDDDCDGEIDEDLVRECVTPCERGIEICQGGNWNSCTAQAPVDEACDGADNDCDGQVDEQLQCLCDVDDVGNLQPCSEPPLICGQGFKTCECVDPDCTELRMSDCEALCAYFPQPNQDCDPVLGMAIAAEECNAFDEDCDQQVDENLEQQCYTGDPDTLGVGVCTPGLAYCNLGTWGNDLGGVFTPGLCEGEVQPSQEICDGADNDCDGEIDYGEEIRETDILFVVDWSGSMDDDIAAVRTALNQFAQHFSAEESLHWGLIVGPKEVGEFQSLVKVADISPFDQFLQAFSDLGVRGMNTSEEMLLDALYLSLQNITVNANYDVPSASWRGSSSSIPEKENFTISWRPTAERIIILFSDEGPQSFLNPPITDNVIVDSLRGAIEVKFYAFVDRGHDGDSWEDIILAGNGERFRLTPDAATMYNDLMSIIDEACLPRQQGSNLMIRSMKYYFTTDHVKSYDYKLGLCF